jgi:hypothetical protein
LGDLGGVAKVIFSRSAGTLCRQPEKQSTRSFRVVVQPNINGIENGLVNAKVNVIDNGCADLSVLALAKMLR